MRSGHLRKWISGLELRISDLEAYDHMSSTSGVRHVQEHDLGGRAVAREVVPALPVLA